MTESWVWVASALIGVLFGGYRVLKTIRELRFIREHGLNGRSRAIAKTKLRAQCVRWVAFALMLFVGAMSLLFLKRMVSGWWLLHYRQLLVWSLIGVNVTLMVNTIADEVGDRRVESLQRKWEREHGGDS